MPKKQRKNTKPASDNWLQQRPTNLSARRRQLAHRPIKHGPDVAILQEMKITDAALKAMENTIGRLSAESGGVLLGDPETMIIDGFIFDEYADASSAVYNPNADFLNKALEGQEERFIGIAHSHPPGITRPSGPDRQAAWANLTNPENPQLKAYAMPILQTEPDTGRFQIHPYFITCHPERPVETILHTPSLRRIDQLPDSGTSKTAQDIRLNERYKRISGAIDLQRMDQTTLIVCGCGAIGTMLEHFSRIGVKRFHVFDPDEVSRSNLAVQNFVRSDVGKRKPKALERRLKAVQLEGRSKKLNKFNFKSYGDFLEPTDEWFEELVRSEREFGQNVVLLMASDFHPAQARGSKLAIKLEVPAFWVGTYQGARAAEIVFHHPDYDLPCYRCIAHDRYTAYEERQDGGGSSVSSGSPFATYLTDALLGQLMIGCIHLPDPNNRSGQHFRQLLDARRNLVYVQFDPSWDARWPEKNNKWLFRGNTGPDSFGFNTTFHEDFWRADCPDCGEDMEQQSLAVGYARGGNRDR